MQDIIVRYSCASSILRKHPDTLVFFHSVQLSQEMGTANGMCDIFVRPLRTPAVFFIGYGACFITVDHSLCNHLLTDTFICSGQGSYKTAYHVFMVPVANGMLKTLPSISWVRLMLIVTTVFKAMISVWNSVRTVRLLLQVQRKFSASGLCEEGTLSQGWAHVL